MIGSFQESADSVVSLLLDGESDPVSLRRRLEQLRASLDRSNSPSDYETIREIEGIQRQIRLSSRNKFVSKERAASFLSNLRRSVAPAEANVTGDTTTIGM